MGAPKRRLLTTSAAAIVGAGAITGCGSGGPAETVTVAGAAETTTVDETVTETVEETETVTVTETVKAKPKPKPASTGDGGRTFTGNGTKTIPPVRVRTGGNLRWKCPGNEYGFSIYDRDFELGVTSDANSGNTYVAPGTYQGVEISGFCDWTVTFPR